MSTLRTASLAKGRELAMKLAQKTIAAIQPSADIRQKLRPLYGPSPALLMQAGHMVAIKLQTIIGNKFYLGVNNENTRL